MKEHHLVVDKTARYCTLGEPSSALKQVWFVIHGHGQLAPYFIRHFAVLDDGSRQIVAPEGLNRFYLDKTSWQQAGKVRVGASWMTREDRLTEIADYVAYLDRLYQAIFAEVDRDRVRVTVLGFSQGVATACRWLCRGAARADALILWAGPLPDGLDAQSAAPLRAVKVTRVLGDRDDLAVPEAVEAENSRARTLGLTAELVRFDGGHELNQDLLRSLAV